MHLHCKPVWLCGKQGLHQGYRPCWCVWPLHQACLDAERGCPNAYCSVPRKRRNSPQRGGRREFFSFSQCRWAGWQSSALQPRPVELECCILEQQLWNLPAKAGLVVGLSLLPDMRTSARASPKLGLMASSTQLVLQCCDGKESKRLTEAGS